MELFSTIYMEIVILSGPLLPPFFLFRSPLLVFAAMLVNPWLTPSLRGARTLQYPYWARGWRTATTKKSKGEPNERLLPGHGRMVAHPRQRPVNVCARAPESLPLEVTRQDLRLVNKST